jgi:hypothetical protein
MPFVNRDGFYVEKGCLFQHPGPKNHLGQVKFLTRRSDAIILHSTHEPELFSNDVRALSLGCVRVQDFAGLAKSILTACGIKTDVAFVLRSKLTKEVILKAPFSVYVVYQTVWVRKGVICVYPDIYGRNNGPTDVRNNHIKAAIRSVVKTGFCQYGKNLLKKSSPLTCKKRNPWNNVNKYSRKNKKWKTKQINKH